MAAGQFLSEIRMFAGNFAPYQWALCDGQIIPISQNAALFSLLGTAFGGNGSSNFGLPNLQGCGPMGFGGTPLGLTPLMLGQKGGSSQVTLLASQIAAHTHSLVGGTTGLTHGGGAVATPVNNSFGPVTAGTNLFAATGGGPPMAANFLSPTGGNQPHNNMQPYLSVSFIIALQGIFPPRG